MDLNYLLSRHQVSLVRADTAASAEARHAHHRLAALYAARIDERRQALGGAFSLGATPA